MRGMLSLADGPQTLKEFDMTNLGQTWRVHWLCQNKINGQYQAFAAPSPARDWHGGPFFPTHGELAQGLSLTKRRTRTVSPLCFFSTQWPETWLSPGSCANILGPFEVCFHKVLQKGLEYSHRNIYIYIYIFFFVPKPSLIAAFYAEEITLAK